MSNIDLLHSRLVCTKTAVLLRLLTLREYTLHGIKRRLAQHEIWSVFMLVDVIMTKFDDVRLKIRTVLMDQRLVRHAYERANSECYRYPNAAKANRVRIRIEVEWQKALLSLPENGAQNSNKGNQRTIFTSRHSKQSDRASCSFHSMITQSVNIKVLMFAAADEELNKHIECQVRQQTNSIANSPCAVFVLPLGFFCELLLVWSSLVVVVVCATLFHNNLFECSVLESSSRLLKRVRQNTDTPCTKHTWRYHSNIQHWQRRSPWRQWLASQHNALRPWSSPVQHSFDCALHVRTLPLLCFALHTE